MPTTPIIASRRERLAAVCDTKEVRPRAHQRNQMYQRHGEKQHQHDLSPSVFIIVEMVADHRHKGAPKRSSLRWPTPLTLSRSPALIGICSAISSSVASLNTT